MKRNHSPKRPSKACAAVGLAALAVASCAPLLDPNHPDQAPDINYNATALKDASFVGSIASIDALVNSRVGEKFPGAAVAVVCGNRIVYMKGYGDARFVVPDGQVPFTKNTVAGIGSISKVLTAIAMMRLAEMGEVDLDETIDEYFSHAVPSRWDEVTVRQLLAHRAGFQRDPDDDLDGFNSAAEIDASFNMEKASQHPRYAIWEFLQTSHGNPEASMIGKHRYSNIGYTVAGAIIDRVTQDPKFAPHQGYERFVWSLLADAKDAAITPALNHYWRGEGDIPNLARSYKENWFESTKTYSGWHGPAGGWSMTIGDLARIAIALKENQILSPASLQQMRQNFGNWYGLGLFLDPKANRVAYGHGGAINGFRSQMTIWPGKDVAVVAFVNRGEEKNEDDEIVDLYWEVDKMVSEIGDLWIDFKENIQVVEVVFNEDDRRQMNTARFELSRRHARRAQEMLQAVRKTAAHDPAEVQRLLSESFAAQGGRAGEFYNLASRNPENLAPLSEQFLGLLESDGQAGLYKPGLTKATLGVETKGRWIYAENGGWIDGRWDDEAPDGGKGVKVMEHILAGQAFAGNFGWLSLGDGSPKDGVRYGNEGQDFGVNFDLASGKLRGFAYGANIGWIQFADRGNPRIDLSTGCFLGYAYSANCGWINLAPREGRIGWQTVSLAQGADEDGDGLPDPWEIDHAGDLTTLSGWTDHDGDGQSDESEYWAGTDPTDPDSALSLWVSPSPGETDVFWTSQATRVYTLFESENLKDWIPVPEVTDLAGNPGRMGFAFPHEGVKNRFWRVEAKLPFGN